jgi:ribose 5-phosphate isomerase A
MKTQQDSRAKQAAGEAAAKLIKDGMLIGLGTGTTAAFFIQSLAIKCQQGLKVRCVATSNASFEMGQKLGLNMVDMKGITRLDMTIDGADEIDNDKNMIKGGGGALLREKILASISDEMVVVVDSSKVVERLGAFPLPVEVVEFGLDATVQEIEDLGFNGKVRTKDGKIYITDGGNRIIDIDLSTQTLGYHEINDRLNDVVGVVETGFFFGLAGRVVVGGSDGTVKTWG